MIKPLKGVSTTTLRGTFALGLLLVAGCAATAPAKNNHQVHIVDVGTRLAELDVQRQLSVPLQTYVRCQ